VGDGLHGPQVEPDDRALRETGAHVDRAQPRTAFAPDTLLPEMRGVAAGPVDAACVAPSGLPQGAQTRAGHDWATLCSGCWTRTSDPAVNRRGRRITK
jgi:hypothetical protein